MENWPWNRKRESFKKLYKPTNIADFNWISKEFKDGLLALHYPKLKSDELSQMLIWYKDFTNNIYFWQN